VPLAPTAPDQTAGFARQMAGRLARECSELITDDARSPARPSRVLVDWRQAEPRRLMVAPYSLRATDQPLVSAPISWDEVTALGRHPDPVPFAIGPVEALARVERQGDLFAAAISARQVLPSA
jgi:bifunctional non-homologous end joining protein LigD